MCERNRFEGEAIELLFGLVKHLDDNKIPAIVTAQITGKSEARIREIIKEVRRGVVKSSQ